MKHIIFAAFLWLGTLAVQAQLLAVTGFELSLPNDIRIVLSPEGEITGIMPAAGAVMRVGPTITAIGNTALMRSGGKIIKVGDIAITRIGGQILSVGELSLTRSGSKIVTIGEATVTRIGHTILSLKGDDRVRLVLGQKGF